MKVALAVFALLAVAAARPDNPPRQYEEPSSYGPASYNYNWAVKDDYSGNNYGQEETRNGDQTSGSYYVALPDGRLQRVTYTVDGYGGYQAEVTYEGEAQYPKYEQPKAYAQPKPAPQYEA